MPEDRVVILLYIVIETAPNKTVYYAGETFDPAGMQVWAYYLGIEQKRASPVEIEKTVFSNADEVVDLLLTITYPYVVMDIIPFPINLIIFLWDLLNEYN